MIKGYLMGNEREDMNVGVNKKESLSPQYSTRKSRKKRKKKVSRGDRPGRVIYKCEM